MLLQQKTLREVESQQNGKNNNESQRYFQQNENIIFVSKASYYTGDSNGKDQISKLEIYQQMLQQISEKKKERILVLTDHRILLYPQKDILEKLKVKIGQTNELKDYFSDIDNYIKKLFRTHIDGEQQSIETIIIKQLVRDVLLKQVSLSTWPLLHSNFSEMQNEFIQIEVEKDFTKIIKIVGFDNQITFQKFMVIAKSLKEHYEYQKQNDKYIVDIVFKMFQNIQNNKNAQLQENELKAQILKQIEENKKSSNNEQYLFNIINESLASSKQDKNLYNKNQQHQIQPQVLVEQTLKHTILRISQDNSIKQLNKDIQQQEKIKEREFQKQLSSIIIDNERNLTIQEQETSKTDPKQNQMISQKNFKENRLNQYFTNKENLEVENQNPSQNEYQALSKKINQHLRSPNFSKKEQNEIQNLYGARATARVTTSQNQDLKTKKVNLDVKKDLDAKTKPSSQNSNRQKMIQISKQQFNRKIIDRPASQISGKNSFFESKENTSTIDDHQRKKEKNEMSSTQYWFNSQNMMKNDINLKTSKSPTVAQRKETYLVQETQKKSQASQKDQLLRKFNNKFKENYNISPLDEKNNIKKSFKKILAQSMVEKIIEQQEPKIKRDKH